MTDRFNWKRATIKDVLARAEKAAAQGHCMTVSPKWLSDVLSDYLVLLGQTRMSERRARITGALNAD